jgi:uncharacterized protein YidB (DUF937 family)
VAGGWTNAQEEDMAFDGLIDDISSRFDLGSNAGPLIREILAMTTGSPGGVSGFLTTLKSAGLSSEVASWLGHANASPLSPQQIDRALGSSVNGIASRLGLLSTLASTAVGYALRLYATNSEVGVTT